MYGLSLTTSASNLNLSPTEERTAVSSLAALYVLRMLGLFMVLPVMVVHGQELLYSSPELLGLALGIYGLTQALLQIPAGSLSDRIGRKPVIYIGLTIFAIGSVVAAISDTVYGVILGRALQGAGAIASAIMALLTDLTREENRMKAMASVGASIGLAFTVALILGPWMAGLGGLSAIFWLTAVLAICGIGVTAFLIPTPRSIPHRDSHAMWPEIKTQLKNRALWPITIGVFLLHAIMVAIFVAIPQQLEAAGLPTEQHSLLYLPVLIAALILMVPLIIIAEKKRKMKGIVQLGAVLIATSLVLMATASSVWHWCVLIGVYFWGFNLLEASLPSWLSKIAPAASKGSVMGIFSSMQFFGAFVGGAIAGIMLTGMGSVLLFIALGLVMLGWLAIISTAKSPQFLTSVRLSFNPDHRPSDLTALMGLSGVAEVRAVDSEDAIYLKVCADSFDRAAAMAIIHSKGD